MSLPVTKNNYLKDLHEDLLSILVLDVQEWDMHVFTSINLFVLIANIYSKFVTRSGLVHLWKQYLKKCREMKSGQRKLMKLGKSPGNFGYLL